MDVSDYLKDTDFGVTICDKSGIVIYQNDKSRKIFEKYGNIIGKHLQDCHGAESWHKICRLMETGESHTYTIEKKGIRKLIHQGPWRENGKIMGLVELSVELPAEIPHFKRD